jgi:CDGSH-type Zn-finger protein
MSALSDATTGIMSFTLPVLPMVLTFLAVIWFVTRIYESQVIVLQQRLAQLRINHTVGAPGDGQQTTIIKSDVVAVSDKTTAYCRCWKSGTFPLCDGTHREHNKVTGDNVGPLVVKGPVSESAAAAAAATAAAATKKSSTKKGK